MSPVASQWENSQTSHVPCCITMGKQSNITCLGRGNIPLIIVSQKTVKHHTPGYAAALLFWLPYPYPPDKITWIFASKVGGNRSASFPFDSKMTRNRLNLCLRILIPLDSTVIAGG